MLFTFATNSASCAYIDADSVSACDQSLNERRSTANMRIETKVAGTCECLDGGTGEGRTKASRIFVEAVGEAPHRLSIARTFN